MAEGLRGKRIVALVENAGATATWRARAGNAARAQRRIVGPCQKKGADGAALGRRHPHPR